MIEAVNATISNTQALRAVAEQASSGSSVDVQIAQAEKVRSQVLAPYVSPYIQVDTTFDTAVIQIRDSDTGDVLTQFPSEPVLKSREAVAIFIDGGESAYESPQAAEERPASEVSTPTYASEKVQTVTVAQSTPPVQSLGAATAQAAITALSIGASSGQATPTANVNVNA